VAFKRTIPADLLAHLQGTALTLAACFKVTRRDGQVLGFTTHNANLVVGGVTYEAASAMGATALRQELAANVDHAELAGIVESSRIAAADLHGGLYENAELEVFWVNWADLTDGTLTLARGRIGQIRVADGRFYAEFRSLSQRLGQNVGELYGPVCRAAFTDSRCGLTPATYTFSRTVDTVTSAKVLRFSGDVHSTGYFNEGLVTFTTGDNTGISREIKTHASSSGAVITLHEAFPRTVDVGDVANLLAGCAHTIEACRAFGNAVRFRGEPNIPGLDQVLQVGRKS